MWKASVSVVLVAICLGCGQIGASREAGDKSLAAEASYELRQRGLALENYRETKVDGLNDEDAPERLQREAADNRKIIYTATLAIVVDDFSGVEDSVAALVKQHGGFVAAANVSLNQGSQRSGTWTVRIPVASFEQFLNASGDLGVPEQREQHGQDVTEEFVDLDARIRSKKKLEERILELLADNKGEIKDVIEVERELSRVRTEIEQMEGRLRYLTDRTDLTTVTLHVREEQDYTPPQAPGLSSQIATTWSHSTGAIVAAAQNLLLAFVACVPWLLLAVVALVPIWRWRARGIGPGTSEA